MEFEPFQGAHRPARIVTAAACGAAVVLWAGAAYGSSQTVSRMTRGGSAQTTSVHLTGAGSTFDAPFFAAAFALYHKINPHISISYAAVGSGDGIKDISAKTVNFGASDVPMSAAEQSGAKGGAVVQVPVDLGAVVLSYNLPYLGSTPLRLSGPVLAQIFLGQITSWNDPAIEALNPNLSMPDEAITVVHRLDSSGTTYIFTNFLSSVSSAWADGPGTNKVIKWPIGLGGTGSGGIAALLKRTPGAIGYFELDYAESESLPYATIENQAGNFVPPFVANVAADAATKANVSASDFSIINEPGIDSYPISSYSWLLIYVHQMNQTDGKALANLAIWLTHAGQSEAAATYYVPLPPVIRSLARQTIARIVGPSNRSLTS